MESLERRDLLATMTLNPVKDNSLFEQVAGTLSNGAGEFLYAGETRSFGSRRALMAFDLAAAGIPATATVTEVKLTLTVSKAALNTTSTESFALHRVNSDWGEGTSNAGSPGGAGTQATQGDATWVHTFFNSSEWDTAGGDFESTASATADAGGNGTTAVWSSDEMRADVQQWVSDAATNFGWIMIGDESQAPNARRFNSREHFDSSTHPQLEITYEEAPAETLSLSITDAAISELDGKTTATVSRTGNSGTLTVDLMSDDTSEATVVASIEIPDGQTTSPEFEITAVDDSLLDGTQTVTISASGTGVTGGSAEIQVTDFEALTLSVADAVISEDGGATTATVTRTDPSGDLIVNLLSDDTSEATVVASVTIADGETVSPTFAIDAVDDALLDGTQSVNLTASASGYVDATAVLEVADREALTLTISDAAISENGGQTTGTVTRTDSSSELSVTLVSDDTASAVVNTSVTLSVGQTSADISIDAVDDMLVDGTQTVTITASATGYESAAAPLEVTDFEPLTVTIDGDTISENGGSATGTVTRTDTSSELVVDLSSDLTTEATVPATITIAAGASQGTFAITAVDDLIGDGDRLVGITAAATGYVSDTATLTVTDDELTVTLQPSKDNSLLEWADGPRSSGAGDSLFVGVNGNDDIRRALLAFDIANSGIPAGSTILSVRLDTTVIRSSPGAGPAMISLHRVAQDWGEANSGAGQSGGGSGFPAEIGDATFDHAFFDTVLWNTPGGDFAATPSATSEVGAAPTIGSWSSAGLVSDVQSWLHEPANNFGWILIGDESTFSTSRRLDSRETVDGTPPALIVGYEAPTEQLTLTLDSASISENGGTAQATVSRSGDTADAVVVLLASGDDSELSVPSQVTIPAGAAAATFDVVGVDDSVLDGTRNADIMAVATGHSPTSATVEVTDFEELTVTIAVTAISEVGGSTTVTVSRTDATGELTVDLASDNESEATVPSSVTLLDGELSASVSLVAVDDFEQDGNQTVSITASAVGYEAGQQTIQVIDDETANPTTVSIDNGVLTIRGGDRDDNLTLRIEGDNLVVGDPANLISDGASSSSEATIALDSFPSGVVIETIGGSNRVTLDASVSQAIVGQLELLGGTGDDSLIVGGSELTLELTQLSDVERVDLAGSGRNTLSLTVAEVEQNLDGDGRFFVVSDLDDVVNIGAGWSLTDTQFLDEFFRVLTQGGTSLFLNGPADWQNPVNRLDVSNDGVVSPVGDVLPLINEINGPQIVDEVSGFPAPTPDRAPGLFMDVNGDGSLSPVGDILTLINFLNTGAENGVGGEGEGSLVSFVSEDSEEFAAESRLVRTVDLLDAWGLVPDEARTGGDHEASVDIALEALSDDEWTPLEL